MDQKPSSRSKAANIISFLPTHTSFAVRYHPQSPGGEASHAKMKNLRGRGFSGPLVSMEARHKDKDSPGANVETQEPSSPKVSCIGQIKHKKKATGRSKIPSTAAPGKHEKKETAKKKLGAMHSLRMIFRRKARSEPEEALAVARGGHVKHDRPTAPVIAPSLGQMKRFASGRDTLESFDWKKVDRMHEEEATAVENDERHRFNWRSDEDKEEEEEEEEDVIIPHSAPIMIGGGGAVALEPKKEVNIWKRRTFAPVTPLQLS